MNDDTCIHHHYGATAVTPPPTVLLVWDAPNLDMGLGSILGARPSGNQRPRFDAIGSWLVTWARQLSEEHDVAYEPEATLFANVAPDAADVMRPWVDALRNMGFAVFAKPKSTEDSDVDADMLTHIRRRYEEGVLGGLVIASADGRNFHDTATELAATGIPVTVLGFQEHTSWAMHADSLTFIDLEDIPGVFLEPLPRLRLDQLPPEGAWLQPFRPLRAISYSSPS